LSEKQRTIAGRVEFGGVGLFSGKPVRLVFCEAPPDTGVVFTRTDLEGNPTVPASIDCIRFQSRRAVLARGVAVVESVEHLLAALACLLIDNLIVELDAPEVAASDGSAEPFIQVLRSAGIKELDAPVRFFRADEPMSVVEGGASILLLPDKSDFRITYTLQYDHPLIEEQHLSVRRSRDDFVSNIAPARTFCLEEEARLLERQGVGKGATYENVIVVGSEGIINNSLRFPDEFARHKILDILGDLFLVGARIKGHIVGYKSGHIQNFRLARKMVDAMEAKTKSKRQGLERHLDIRQIQKILPHRYPMLLVDRVIEIDGEKRAVGIKNVTANEEFFQGHFPEQPIMPGVLQIEAMAQLAGVLLLRKLEDSGKLAVFLGIDKVKFRKPVVPGDQLRLEAEAVRVKSRTGQVNTRALVDGEIVAEAQIKFMLVDRDSYTSGFAGVHAESD